MEITRAMFDEQRHPRFGTSNPERMRVPFWEWMVRGDGSPPPAEPGILGQFGLMVRNGVLIHDPDETVRFSEPGNRSWSTGCGEPNQTVSSGSRMRSGSGPWLARDRFAAPPSDAPGPVWTFDRMGQTRTDLPDGRVVFVAGEHEDYYDPDFHIYNDVVVCTPDGELEIYGYPRTAFPPTDFHTATLDDNRLVLIGSVGYPADRVPGHTPVYALDLATYRVEPLVTSGEGPGWVAHHEAEFDPARRVVTVRGGKAEVVRPEGRRLRPNVEEYELDLGTLVWRQATARNWPLFSIRRTDKRLMVLDERPSFDTFRSDLPREPLPWDAWGRHRLVVDGVPVEFTVGVGAVEGRVEGSLPAAAVDELVDAARRHVEAAVGHSCVAERY